MKTILWLCLTSGLCISSVEAAAPLAPSILAGPVYNPTTTHTYFLLTTSDWTDAEAAAVRLGGHLATVNDQAENDWLASIFSNYGGVARSLWIGLSDAAHEGVFTWSSGEPVTYTHWEVGQPDNGGGFYPNENYVHMWPSPGPRSPGYWNDKIDSNTFPDFSFQVYGVVELSGNNWTNPFSAKWESPSWSLGRLPGPDQDVHIMNDGYKAVNIDITTIANYSQSLTVGSLAVGAPTNALSTLLLNYFGESMPLKVLNSGTILTNGTLLNLGSSFEVDGGNSGALTIDGGIFAQEGGLTVVSAPVQVLDGFLNATNATMNLGALQVGGNYPKRGIFNQSGGTVLSSAITTGNGRYLLESNGVLYAIGGTHVADGAGDFLQTGGTYYGDVNVGLGYYYLQGGLLHGSNIDTITLGFFDHSGGTVEVQNVSARGLGTDFSIFPGYRIYSNGILHSATITLTHWGFFRQSGGTLVLTNQFNLVDPAGPPVRFELDGGNTFLSSLVVSNAGDYLQYGGTNQIAGDLLLYNSAIAMYGGRLVTGNTGIGEGSRLYHQGGTHEVTGVLSITGSYSLIEGDLLVSGVYLRGNLLLAGGSPPPPIPPVLNNTGVLNFGGLLAIGVSERSMGQLQLATNGNIYLEASPLQVRFADSSALTWDTNSRLFINGWNGSYFGGGSNQVYFGTSSTGLSPTQVSLIRFVNPAGSPAGTYTAQILATGEVVPVAAPTLESTRSGNQLVLSWAGNYQLLSATNVTGPYEPVPGASSPYTIDTRAQPLQFFRLQGQY